jgi:type II secretory pathway component GspD/PulD (secretin)
MPILHPPYVLKMALVGVAAFAALSLSGCAAYDDEVRPPSEQTLQDSRTMLKPKPILREGVFHMQRVTEGSSVRVNEKFTLKKPDLPPFEVAYVGRDMEDVVLELSSAAGESVVIPASLKGQTVTLVHSGANFPDMLGLVLSKAGYSYNYVNGVWYITRYPVRNYVLEIGQSNRKGSMTSKSELSPELAAGTNTASGNAELDTDYSDMVWSQVRDTLLELAKVGASNITTSALNAIGVTATGQLIPQGGVSNTAIGATGVLPPPAITGVQPDTSLFAPPAGAIVPAVANAPAATSGSSATEENAQPWYKVTESAGLITVRASPEAHRQIEEYLEQVQQSSLRQIVLEARIVALIRDKTTTRGADVSLDLSSITNSALNRIGFFADSQGQVLNATTATVGGGFFTLGSNGNNMALVMQNLSTLGDVYTISTPTLVARNNQLSRVSVTRQLGYAETEVQNNTTSTGDVVIGSRQDKAKFKNSGTVMSVMPFIGKNRVQLRFRLSVASKAGDTSIKTSVGSSTPVVNLVPEMASNVIDQDMVLEFGRVYAIGGLVENNTTVNASYEPTLRQIPGLGEVFQKAKNRGLDTEFLVLLKVNRG